MNNLVRTYLIEIARQREKFVNYGDLVKDCRLQIDLNTDYGRKQLGVILGDISEYEHTKGRPLISALVTYKGDRMTDHGDGFYRLSESLGYGDYKQLKDNFWGILESTKCRTFWQDDSNYNLYANLNENGVEKKIPTLKSSKITLSDYFNILIENNDYVNYWKDDCLNFVNEVGNLRKAILSNPLLDLDDPILYQSQSIKTYENFMWKWLKERSNGISTRGQSVLSDDNFYKIINDIGFKRIAKDLIVNPELKTYNNLCSWWFNNDDIYNRPLIINRAIAACCPEKVSTTAHAPKFWQVFDYLGSYYGFESRKNHYSNWFVANEELTTWLDSELKAELEAKTNSNLEQHIWRNMFIWLVFVELNKKPNSFPNGLIEATRPTGLSSMPETKHVFNGINIDYVAQAKFFKEIGDAGEELVKQWEKDNLERLGRTNDAKNVKIVKDGLGYDVHSYDEHGNNKFIEVKTTPSNKETPFYLTSHEVAFMRENVGKYSIYRIYNYDEDLNFGEFFEIKGEVEKELFMEPTEFKVNLKKTN